MSIMKNESSDSSCLNEVIQAILNGIRNALLSYPGIHCENIAGDNTNQLNLSTDCVCW